MAGMFANGGSSPNMQYVPQDLLQGAPAKPSFFAPGGTGRNIAGYLGDALAQYGGGHAAYGPMVAQRAQMEQQTALAQQQQAAEYQRQMAIAQYKHDNPDPTGTMQNIADAGFTRGTPEYQAFARKVLLAPRVVGVAGEGGGTDYVDFNSAGGGAAPAAQSAPQPGTVQGGYVFLGGDPAVETNWKKQ